jgi:hypothetical protein
MSIMKEEEARASIVSIMKKVKARLYIMSVRKEEARAYIISQEHESL